MHRRIRRLLGKDYEVITADERLDKVAVDFVEYCATRWESGKTMLVCIDKLTCGRMYKRIIPLWQRKLASTRAQIRRGERELLNATGDVEALVKKIDWLKGQANWLEESIVEIIISEGQNEVADFVKLRHPVARTPRLPNRA